MKSIVFLTTALALLVGLAGCSGKSEEKTPAVTPPSGGTANSSVSTLDQGPRAAESPIQEALVKRGEQLFKDKGCSACHAFGRKVTCPDLSGVTHRRTAVWIENQILHPDKMTKEDPIARQLFAQFALQMPNQGLVTAEAQAVIEYFKHQDHEADEAKK